MCLTLVRTVEGYPPNFSTQSITRRQRPGGCRGMRKTEWDRRIRELVTETEDLLHTHTDTHSGTEDRLRELKDSQ